MTTDTVISLYYPILFSFSLVLPTMINLFKKNIHSKLLSCTTTVQCQHHSISDLGLITATMNIDRSPNVLESATLKPNPPPPSTSPSGGIEFNDDRVDGLMSCTESLGFESSDEIHNKNGDEKVHDDDDDDEIWRRRMMMRAEGRGNWRSFPPPLSSLNRNGKPSFFLRPVRKDGRLELTEVRIHRPEILHASRHDGRLTLHLIPDQTTIEEEEEEEEEELDEDEELVEEEEEELVGDVEVKEEIIMEEEEEEGEVVEENGYGREERVAEWGFRVGSNEGLRRCHEMVNQHHHHVHGNHHHLRMCGISIV